MISIKNYENIVKTPHGLVIASHAINHDEEGNFIGNRFEHSSKYHLKIKARELSYLERIDSRYKKLKPDPSYPEGRPVLMNYQMTGVLY